MGFEGAREAGGGAREAGGGGAHWVQALGLRVQGFGLYALIRPRIQE